MTDKTFTTEIAFKHLTFDPENPTERKLEKVTKMATFKELDQMDRSQHKFHGRLFAFFAMSPFGESEEDGGKMSLDTDGIYDLTVSFVKNFLTTDNEFGIKDREKLLSDSTAMFDLGLWFMKNTFTPFFLKSRTA